MLFSSIEFLLCFLPVFLVAYGLTPNRYKNVTLVAGSLVFYALGEGGYLLLLLVSVSLNYIAGLHIAPAKPTKKRKKRAENRKIVSFNRIQIKREKRRKWIFWAAVLGNVGLLMFFKGGIKVLGLPLGISFYTFQMISYLTDVYRGELVRERSLTCFAAYVTMFPRLVSGPIVNYSEVNSALHKRAFNAKTLQEGLQLFTAGLCAKVLMADRIGILWHEVQVTGFESISALLAWLAALAYSMKIYFDFYGYSLMAIGLGKMLGFRLPENFSLPYMAGSVREFYRRWHMTLGRWFCRYVYIPLGGSRKGELRTVLNLLAVWVLTSVWHGSTMNFLAWGLLLWLCIVLERQLQKITVVKKLRVLPHLYLWLIIPISWMCFAITDLGQLQVYLGRMFGLTKGIYVRSGDWLAALKSYGSLLLTAFLCCTPLAERVYRKGKNTLPGKLILAVLFWVCVNRLLSEGNNPFMYFSY